MKKYSSCSQSSSSLGGQAGGAGVWCYGGLSQVGSGE